MPDSSFLLLLLDVLSFLFSSACRYHLHLHGLEAAARYCCSIILHISLLPYQVLDVITGTTILEYTVHIVLVFSYRVFLFFFFFFYIIWSPDTLKTQITFYGSIIFLQILALLRTVKSHLIQTPIRTTVLTVPKIVTVTAISSKKRSKILSTIKRWTDQVEEPVRGVIRETSFTRYPAASTL